jgi:hypothetical protein
MKPKDSFFEKVNKMVKSDQYYWGKRQRKKQITIIRNEKDNINMTYTY